MHERPYHHGNLRTALLAEATRTVREKGAQALSLRELARDVGVSHAAPRRHFADRQALLEALAVWGFEALGAELVAAEHTGDDFQTRLRALAAAYIRFATRDAAMLELMFASKREEHDGQLGRAADNAFRVMLDLIRQGQEERILPAGEPERVGLVLFATIQGIAAMLTAGIVGEEQLEDLVEDATVNFVRGCRAELEGRSALPRSKGPSRARRRTPA